MRERDSQNPKPIRGRYTLDIAHVVGESVIRRHIVCVSFIRAIELEYAERLQPGMVYSERSAYVPGDHTWCIQYRNPLVEV